MVEALLPNSLFVWGSSPGSLTLLRQKPPRGVARPEVQAEQRGLTLYPTSSAGI